MQNNPFVCISDACVHRNMQYVAAHVLFQLTRQASEETDAPEGKMHQLLMQMKSLKLTMLFLQMPQEETWLLS